MTDADGARALVGKAATSATGRAAREGVCRALAVTFREAGKLLWTFGYMLGTDRRDGESPFGFGSDATVGLAVAVEIAGELLSGAVTLFADGNLYSGAALLRQIVEVEYLTWAFAEDQEEAMTWIRATPDERRRMWQPRHLRERSAGRFRASDYHRHCERGGHPTPEGTTLLATHTRERWPDLQWFDLAVHGVSAWRYAIEASRHVGYVDEVKSVAGAHGLPEAIARWEHGDRLLTVGVEVLPTLRAEPVAPDQSNKRDM